jgi:hypothetical protein
MYRMTALILFLLLQGCVGGNDSDENQVTVYKNNGAIQCESEGLSELETAQQLIDNGIDVILSTCGILTGVSVLTVCGAENIYINLHVINTQNLADAEELGFESVSSLKNEDDSGYMILGCEE